jgi:hypothetical protein
MSTASSVVWILLKVISLSLIYLVFLYEDEEGRIQDRVTEWWIRIDDARMTSLSWAATFMQGAARIATKAIDYSFGIQAISFRLFGTSFFFSIASLQLLIDFAPRPRWEWPHLTTPVLFADSFLAILFIALGLVPAFTKSRWIIAVWYLYIIKLGGSFLWAIFSISSTASAGASSVLSGVSIFLAVGIGIGFLCDILWIFCARQILKGVLLANDSAGVYRNVLAACGLLFGMLSVFPALVGFALLDIGARFGIQSTGLLFAGVAISCTFVFNGVSLLTCFVASLLAGFLLLHRLVWPSMQKPLYILQRYGAIKNKNALWKVGVALLLLPHPQTMVACWKWLVERIPNLF